MYLHIYLFSESVSKERGNGRKSPADSLLSTVPHCGSTPWPMRSWPEIKPRFRNLTNWRSQKPLQIVFIKSSQFSFLSAVHKSNILFTFLLTLVFINHFAVWSINYWEKEKCLGISLYVSLTFSILSSINFCFISFEASK